MTHHIIMPDLGQTAAEGKIIRWLKKPGDKLAKGDALLEVETDKVTMEVESYKAGYLRAVLVEEGHTASAMSPIAILTDTPEEAYEPSGADEEHQSAHQGLRAIAASTEQLVDETSSAAQLRPSGRPVATPAAKARARESGVRLDGVVGTGPEGLVTKRDVESALEWRESSAAASAMAVITAKSAAEIPHFYVTVDIEMGHTLQWREKWNAAHADLHASLNQILVRAAMLALKDVRNLNVRYRDGRLDQRTAADVLLVVATESGLTLVPAGDLSSSSWEVYLKSMRAILDGARVNRFKGSANTAPVLAISNLGMFGVKQFTAIIPPGCTAILAIGAVREEVVVKNKQMRIAEVCSLTLGADHRAVDGVTAAKFLERVQMHLNSL
jgi:pyruvate dehydrogenase E2 component (dihydrolipoamide acetyltransferase)